MSKTNIYKAEALLKERKRKGKTEYLVKWCGWSSKHNSWEPRENIIDERLIEEFEARNARKLLRRGGYRKAVKRVRQSVAHDESNDEDAGIDPSPSRRRGRPRKLPKSGGDGGEMEERDDKTSEPETKKVGSLSLEKEQEEEEEGEEKTPAPNEGKEEEAVSEKDEQVESDKGEVKEGEKSEETSKKNDNVDTATTASSVGDSKPAETGKEEEKTVDTTPNKQDQQSSVSSAASASCAETTASGIDEEAGPSTVKEGHLRTAETKDSSTKATGNEDTPPKPEQLVGAQSPKKDILVPRTFHGHMIPMRIESSERQEELRTHAFVISEPGASATTEELQVFSEVEQIQAIKKELMNESSWSKHESIRHDSFQYNGAHALTEIVGKDGEPVRFISL